MKTTTLLLITVLMLGSSLLAVATEVSHHIDENLGGQESKYSRYLIDIFKKWRSKQADRKLASPSKPVVVKPIRTEENNYYIGMLRHMLVDAPLERLAAVLSDFEHYKDLFDGIGGVNIVWREGNKFVASWERKIPIFFVPNINYELIYVIDKSDPNRVVYRNQLKEPGSLKFNDSLVVLEKESSKKSRYTAYDFYEADWGPTKVLGSNKIWKDNLGGGVLAAFAIKLKAEHPEWDYDKVHEESEKLQQEFLEKQGEFEM